jgi:uncharacterized membrane protein
MSAIAASSTTTSISRPRMIVYIIAAAIALTGLADATYLTVQHFTGENILCGGSADCARVLGSAYSHLGPIPVAGLGVLAYYTVFSLATFAAFGHRRAGRLFVWVVCLMFVGTLWFLFVQAFLLHAFCRFCLLSAAFVFLLTGIVVAMPPPQDKDGTLD